MIIRAAEPISAAKKMIKKDNIESKVLIGKAGALLSFRRSGTLRRAGYIEAGVPFNQTITVGGQNIQYTAYKFADGLINIGRIHGVK